jgi:hypothetical protein
MSRPNVPHCDAPRIKAASPGVVSVHEIYRVDEAKLRLGWTDAAYRAARRRGLAVLSSGKRLYVTGEEILRFLKADDAARSST